MTRPATKTASTDACLLVPSLSPVQAGSSDSLLTHRTLQKWGDSTSQIRLQKDCNLCLSLTLSLWDSRGSWPTCCRLPYGEANVARNRYLQPTGAEGCQQNRNKPETDSLPANIWSAALREALCQSQPATPIWIPDHRNCKAIKTCCFKLLSFVVIVTQQRQSAVTHHSMKVHVEKGGTGRRNDPASSMTSLGCLTTTCLRTQ